jgi:glyoxylase-like metal-dependent hydrolase (beta-lactamase superfamily II)
MAEIIPGQVVQLSPLVRRITAPNPGMMTGPGTNTYLVGSDEIAVIDPGPAIPSHIDAILAAGNNRIRWVLATHTHPDHSPAAKAIAKATGALVMGNLLPENDGRQDDSFAPQQSFAHNDSLSCEGFTLRAILTPGHVGNHVCYLLEQEGMLLTGDHIMQGSTVVIVPPHGDMKDYLDSLKLLEQYEIASIAPGHGYLIDTPREAIEGLIKHRLGREAKVLSVITGVGRGSLDGLTPVVYDDVDEGLFPVARYSLWAHLIKLERDGVLVRDGEEWVVVGG